MVFPGLRCVSGTGVDGAVPLLASAIPFCDEMKTLRLPAAPTRSRRLNELLGLLLLVSATLLLLALASYAPTDPSFNTAGGYEVGRLAHNWTGVVGAYLADAMLQTIGVAALFLPLLLLRLGVCWMRSRPAGSPTAKTIGLMMWLLFAPAAIALLPGHLRWRQTLPVEGVSGRLLGDAMVAYFNLPGATILLLMAVAVSLYLATTFTFNTAREWMGTRFGFLLRWKERLEQRRHQRQMAKVEAGTRAEQRLLYGSKREAAAERMTREQDAAGGGESSTLLGSLFGWWGRKGKAQPAMPEEAAQAIADEPTSMWEAMPRTVVDAPPVTSLGTATAAAAPYADALAKASAPRRALDDEKNFAAEEMAGGEAAFSFVEEANEILPEAPKPVRTRAVKSKDEEAPAETARSVPAAPVPMEAAAAQAISFGKRADTDQKAVAIVPKSVRGYKLPPSSLLYHSEEHSTVREDALRDEARVLVEKCGEFDVDGQVTQINPGPVVTTFEFKPDAGVKYSRVTGLADDLCLAMAAESILIERMPGKSTVGIQVPNHERETIWLQGCGGVRELCAVEEPAGDCAGQGHQRADCDGGPGEHAACADCGIDGIGQVGGDQRDDHERAVQVDAGAGADDPGRSEAGGAGDV